MDLDYLIKNTNTTQFVYLHPRKVYTGLEENLLSELKRLIEGKCLDIGYVLKVNKIVNRSESMITNLDFSGNIQYSVLANIDIVNPQKDDIIKNCKINFVSKIGIFAQKDFLRILIPADSNQNSNIPQNYQDIYKEGDIIDIKVIASKYELLQDNISIWAYLIDNKKINTKKNK